MNLFDRVKGWFSPSDGGQELNKFAVMHQAFKVRLSSLNVLTLKRFAHSCLGDMEVFELVPASGLLLLRSDVDSLCADMFSHYEEVTAREADVTLSRKGVRQLVGEREFDNTLDRLDPRTFTIIGGSDDPKDSMLIQPHGSSEIYHLSEYEPLFDVDSNPHHAARFKNIYVWIAWVWYTSQSNPEMEPMDVEIPYE